MEEPEEVDGASDGDGEAWMATFADLTTLLLTFFVLLLSFANMDVIKFQEMMGSLQNALGYQTTSFGNSNPRILKPSPEASPAEQGAAVDRELHQQIEKLVKEQKLDGRVEVLASQRGVIIRVNDSLMFTPGSARLTPTSLGFLDQLGIMIESFRYDVLIEGHTDSTPIKTATFPSNWELSMARAISTMRYMTDGVGLSTSRFGVAGYADSRPLASNDTAKNRTRNRRVEFVCMRQIDASLRQEVTALPALKKRFKRSKRPKRRR